MSPVTVSPQPTFLHLPGLYSPCPAANCDVNSSILAATDQVTERFMRVTCSFNRLPCCIFTPW